LPVAFWKEHEFWVRRGIPVQWAGFILEFDRSWIAKSSGGLNRNPSRGTDRLDPIRFETYVGYPAFDVPVGQFFVMVAEVDGNKGYWEKFQPNLGSSETQTYLDPGQPLAPQGRKMVTVAFPPGTGTVVILSISVTSS
jgi:hypothetical protein